MSCSHNAGCLSPFNPGEMSFPFVEIKQHCVLLMVLLQSVCTQERKDVVVHKNWTLLVHNNALKTYGETKKVENQRDYNTKCPFFLNKIDYY